MENNLTVGGWVIEDLKACNLPQKIATGFVQVMEGFVGASYIPVSYCASQLVNGTNHLLICKQTLSTSPSIEHIVAMTLHQSLPTDGLVGTFSILSIVTIV